MDSIMQQLANTVAPLVVQILAAVVLAIVSALLLRGKQFVESRLSAQQREFIYDLAETAVHFAEKQGQGLDKAGEEKARIAQNYVDRELRAAGITVISGSDVQAAIIGAVQRAWSQSIGPTYRPDTTPTPETPADNTVSQPATSLPATVLAAQSG